MNRILIVEDEPRIVSFLAKGLRANGFSTAVAERGDKAIEMARDDDFDLMILDLVLPGLDGYEVLREIRRRGQKIPVIILTGRTGIEDTVASLEGGANDYLAKPFRFPELLARIRLRLMDKEATDSTTLRSGDIVLDLHTRRAEVAGRSVELTAREFALAETFLRHPGQVLSRAQLLSQVWGYDYDPSSNIVDVFVRYLRKKLGEDTIETMRGMGYRLKR